MEYRKDIQIVRGISVLLVVLFHLEIAGFKSGFLGVDIFFVISGYLMAVMYDPLKKKDYFLKRAQRLLPAYFALVAATLLASMFIVKPNDYSQVATQVWFATFFTSNIGFWLENTYFDKAAFKPLLHLWSLGVEIQFYLLVPALYWTFKRFKLSYLLFLIGSALLCFVVVGISSKTSFFWLPFRLWEFLIGFGVAKYLYKGQAAKSDKLAWLGLLALVALICIPFIEIDGNAKGFQHGHPGMIALFISLAAAVTLSFGLPKKIEDHAVSGALEKIGGYSYSIYLAHFPVIVLFLYEPFAGTVLKTSGPVQSLILIALIVCASALLYIGVERPLRGRKKSLRWVFVGAIATLGVVQAGSLIQSTLIPRKEMLIYQAWFDRAGYRCGKINRILNPGSPTCELTESLTTPAKRILLLGNSHADSIKNTFAAEAQSRNVSVYFMVDNTPFAAGLEAIVRDAQAVNIDTIVVHSSASSVNPKMLSRLAELAQEKNIDLAFIMPVPTWRDSVPQTLLKNQREGFVLPSQNIEDYEKIHSVLIDGIAAIRAANFKVYPIAGSLCSDGCRMISDDGKPLYFDGSHLTLTGSRVLAGVFDAVIDDVLTQPERP